MRDILRRYGNFMSGYDADGDEIDIDEAIKLICEEIEKVENPYLDKPILVKDFEQVNEHHGFEVARQKILSLLRPVENPVGSVDKL